MKYEDLMTTIRNSRANNWLYNDERGIYTLRADLDIRIQRRDDEEPAALRDFREEWANQHPDPSAKRCVFDIYYRDSWVETFMLIGVDGFRAYLPLPNVRTKVIPFDQYSLARAIDSLGTLDEYIERSGLTVEKQGAGQALAS
jgi:hypothetical protein